MASEKLLGLLQRQEWLYRNAFEQAQQQNKAAHDSNARSLPFSEDEMLQMELDALRAQIELAHEESEP
jgi:hypothetical protein